MKTGGDFCSGGPDNLLSGFARSHSARTGSEFSNRIAQTIAFPNGVWERGKAWPALKNLESQRESAVIGYQRCREAVKQETDHTKKDRQRDVADRKRRP